MAEPRETTSWGAWARVRQDREIALAHSLASAEFALAREASAVALVFEEAGLAFDAETFVSLRILEASLEGGADPLDCLRVLDELGVVDRSVGLARSLRDVA